jgi:hypothetical protein
MAATKFKPMTAREFNNALSTFDMSIVGSAEPLGTSRRQVQRFAAGERRIPRPIAKLIRLALKHNINLKEVE